MAVDTEELRPPQSPKEAKAAAKAAKAHAKAMRPWYKKKRFVLPLGLVAIGIAASAAGGSKSKSTSSSPSAAAPTRVPAGVKSVDTNDTHPAGADVEVTKCTPGEFGIPAVQVKITNHTSKRSNYTVEMNLTDASGNKVGDGVASSNNVEPGQTALEDVAATNSAPFTKCEVKEVSRFAS